MPAALVNFGADGVLLFPNNATIAASSTAPSVGISMRGDFINTVRADTTHIIPLCGIVDGSGAPNAVFVWWGAAGFFAVVDQTGTFLAFINEDPGLWASIDNATMYDILFTVDPASGSTGGIFFYAQGGFLTGPGFIGSATRSGAAGTYGGTGYGCVFVGQDTRFSGSAFGTAGMLVDWCKAGATDACSDLDAPMEEGSGSSVSPGGTLSGTYSWEGGASAPDHGVVTLGTNPVSVGGTGTATVDWQDASNVSLSPQPTTAWSVQGAGGSIVSGTGVYTALFPGTVTIKATSGIVVATATLTINRPFNLLGSITTP